MKRKIVQIAIQECPSNYTNNQTLFALADDGTVWFLPNPQYPTDDPSNWFQVAPLPQPADTRSPYVKLIDEMAEESNG